MVRLLQSGACLDENAADQLIIFASLAQGTSEMLIEEPSLHTMTAIYVAEKLTDAKFSITPQKGGLSLVRCWGAGISWVPKTFLVPPNPL